MKRVAVTGLGVITPLGNSVEEFWENIKNGKSGAAPITKVDVSKFKTQFGCEVRNFVAEEYIDKKEVKKIRSVYPVRHCRNGSGDPRRRSGVWVDE